MNKIIFLDIDGVLNIFAGPNATFRNAPEGEHIEKHLVERLNFILKEIPDIKIVISSSWRDDMEDLKIQLERAGFEYWDRVISKTIQPIPIAYGGYAFEYRGHQIQQWLEENEFYGKYLVIDDYTIEICGEYCSSIPKENVIETNPETGITNFDCNFILEHFKENDGN